MKYLLKNGLAQRDDAAPVYLKFDATANID
jgi:hypothetical protein